MQYNKFKKILCTPVDSLPESLQPLVNALVPKNIDVAGHELLCNFYIQAIKTDYELSILLDTKDPYNTYMVNSHPADFTSNMDIDFSVIKQNVIDLCLVPVTRDFSILDIILIALKQILVNM